MKQHLLLKPLVAVLLVLTLSLSQFSMTLAAPPTNDDFDLATPIPGLPFSDQLDTSEATTDFDDPDCFGNGPTVWYAYTPSQNMRIAADTFGSDYDTTLSVFTGSRGNLTYIDCNDDTLGLQSRVIFDAMANETYFFMIGAYGSGPGGNLVFNVDVGPPPLEFDLSLDPVGLVKASSGVMTIGGVITCSRPSSVEVFGSAQQRAGRLIIQGFFYTFTECDGETPWNAIFSGENGIFKPGRANIFASSFAYSADGEFAEDYEEGTIRLRGQRK